MRLSGLLLASSLSVAQAALQIVPGGSWTASDGRHIQAHGPGITVVNGTYYMIGEDKTDGSSFQNVNCYSSTDLVQWTYVGALLSRTSSGDLGPNRIIERPKVIYNERTRKYVMWMHVDSSDYKDARAGVATGDSVCGKYTYLRSFRPFGFQSRDMGLFKDDDGTGYLLTEDRENGLRINKLNADYTDLAGTTSTYRWPELIESPAMLKYKGRYYVFGSHLTGWDANDNVYSTSTSLTGGWTAWKEFADKGSKTYTSQTSFVLDYGNDNIMYLGDRWKSNNLFSSTYVWLPLTISGTTVTMKNYVSWVPNRNTGGKWAGPPAENSYEGETATKSGGTRDISCSGCSGSKAAGYLGGSDNPGKLTFTGVQSDVDGLTTIRVKYLAGEAKGRLMDVSVNGGASTRLQCVPPGSEPGSCVLHAQLKKGANTIVISGVNSGWAPDIDRLMVPVQ